MYRFPRFLLRLAARLPLSLAHAMGSVLGWTLYGMSPTYRRHLRENLAQAGFADARVRRQAIAAAGRMLAELPALWFRPHERVVALVKEVEGLDAALAAHAQGRPVVFLTPHMGCFEVAAQYAASRMPITVLYRPPKIGWLEPLMHEGRARPNVRLVPADVSGVRAVLAALKRGESAGFLPDQVPGEYLSGVVFPGVLVVPRETLDVKVIGEHMTRLVPSGAAAHDRCRTLGIPGVTFVTHPWHAHRGADGRADQALSVLESATGFKPDDPVAGAGAPPSGSCELGSGSAGVSRSVSWVKRRPFSSQ
mgnify:CR=1 FL=1